MNKRIFSIICLLATMLLISACSSDDAKGDEKKDDKELIIAIDQNFVTLDPQDAGDTVSIFGTRSMYEGLVGFDKDMEIVPVLAEDYEISEDALTYTFKLRKDVTFHDGEPFNAEAVKANYERIIDEDVRAKRNLQYVDKLEVIDDYEVKFILNQPFSAMLNKFAMVPFISPKALGDDSENIGLNPVGTGPFEFSKWNQGDSLELVKYDDYWNEDSTNVEKVTYKPVPENGSRVAMLKTGEADFVYPLPDQNIKDLEENDDVVIDQTPSTIARYVSINTTKEPFNDEKIRKAMNYAVDKNAYINTINNGFGTILDSTMSSETQFYSQQETYDFNLDKAKELMKEAGYEDGFEAEIWGNTTSETVQGMEFIKQQLDQINIDVTIKSMEEGTLSDEIYTPETPEEAKVQMWYVSWSPSSGDADGATRSLFSSEYYPPNGANTAYYHNEDVDKWINAANETSDPEEQTSIYANLQSQAYGDAPWIFLASDTILSGHRKGVENVYVLPDGSVSISNAQLK